MVAIAVCGRALLYESPRHQGIFLRYHTAGRDWLAGRDLYTRGYQGDAFVYSPPIAALMVPFSVLPAAMSSFLWRLFLVSLFVVALKQWLKHAVPSETTARQRAMVFILVLPVTVATLLNANAGALVIILLLLALSAVGRERWNQAALFAVLAGILKVYPFAVGLLLALVYPRRFLPRFLAFAVVCVGCTFLLQNPEYVARQFQGWFAVVRAGDSHPWYRGQFNCDLQLLLTRWLVPLDPRVYRILQLVLASGIAGLCLVGKQLGWERGRLLFVLFALAGCWMTVVGPAVESFTYILIGPTLAWMLIDAWKDDWPLTYRWALAVSWGLFAVAAASQWFPFGSALRRLGPHPVAGLLLSGCVLYQVLVFLRASRTSCMQASAESVWYVGAGVSAK
jgi:hypothetical protein